MYLYVCLFAVFKIAQRHLNVQVGSTSLSKCVSEAV